MREDRPSQTAEWVAALRGVGAFLPERLRLVDDRYGLRFSRSMGVVRDEPRWERRARSTAVIWLRGPLRRWALYMQLRTRVIDDDLVAFANTGGRQIVLLGAGFDCRAWRLGALSNAKVFEVDHPATQARKRAVMAGERPSARVVFVPWDFEREPLARLPERLTVDGLDARAPTMTILEGVVMYLSEQALDATFACVAGYSAQASPLAITYMDRTLVESRARAFSRLRGIVRFVGEPFRSGFDPRDLPGWLRARHFRLERDESGVELGTRLLGSEGARAMQSRHHRLRHFALARRS